MSLFFFVFFTLYGLMHLYLFLKVRAAVPLTLPVSAVIAAVMAVMVVMPVLVHMAERGGFELAARFLSYAGYLWMGIVLLFCSAALLTDLYRLVLSFSAARGLSLPLPALSPMAGLAIPLAAALAISAYGYFEARDIRVEHRTVHSAKIPASAGQIRIVQVSDVHLGLIVREARLRKILEKVRDAKPDILVSTGDLVDGQINNLDGLSQLFLGISPRFGKYAVTGNHEFYAGLRQALDFTERSGFTVLRGTSATVGGFLEIAGVDDRALRSSQEIKGMDERSLLSSVPAERFVVLLKHRPLWRRDTQDLFDLQLSGHVHKGQIFPFSILTWLYYPIDAGFKAISPRARISVSRGTGTWGPPIRFLSPPEVTVIDLAGTGS